MHSKLQSTKYIQLSILLSILYPYLISRHSLFHVPVSVVSSFHIMSSNPLVTLSAKKRSISSAPNLDGVNNDSNQNELTQGQSMTTTSLNAVPGEHVYTSRSFKPRYIGPPEETMTHEQRQIRQLILETRPRTGLSGPFGPWLAVPEIANPAQLLGRACRYGTSLSFRESELVILLVGAKTRSHAEFDIHVGEALKAGISMNIINAIPRDDKFSYASVMEHVVPLLKSEDGISINSREWAIVQFTTELLDTYTVSDYTYAITKQALGNQDSVLVEITSIVGYYTYVSYTLNVFQIPS